MEASSKDDDGKLDDSGIMELDTNTTTSSPRSSGSTTIRKVPRIGSREEQRRRMGTVFPRQADFNRSAISMVRKIVKKAIKTRQRMEVNQERRNRQRHVISQLSTTSKDQAITLDGNNKKEEYEEPPPRPPTRRCMFYREDSEPKPKVLRAKQI